MNNQIKRLAIYLFFVAFPAVAFLSSCAGVSLGKYGGGTTGTGLGYGGGTVGSGVGSNGSPQANQLTSVSYFDYHGSVVDASGKLLAGVRVVVSSERDQSEAVTQQGGSFSLPVVAGIDESIEFTFFRGTMKLGVAEVKIPQLVSGASSEFVVSEGKATVRKLVLGF